MKKKYQLGKNSSESTSLGVKFYDPKLIADMQFLQKMKNNPSFSSAHFQDDYTKKVNSIKKINDVKSLPNAKLIGDQILPINPDRSLSGKALPNTRAIKNDKALEHTQGALDAASIITGIGALRPLLINSLEKNSLRLFRPNSIITKGPINYWEEPGFMMRNPNFNPEKYVNNINKFGPVNQNLPDNLRPFIKNEKQIDPELLNIEPNDHHYINFGETPKKGQGYMIDELDYPNDKNWKQSGLKDASRVVNMWLKENEMSSNDRIQKLLDVLPMNKKGGFKAQMGKQINFNNDITLTPELYGSIWNDENFSNIPGYDKFVSRFNPNNPIQKGKSSMTKPATLPNIKNNSTFNPYNMLRGSSIGLSWLSNNMEINRQNQYMYNQYSLLGQQNPANIDDFQPNYYSLYSKFGGKIK